MRLSVLNLRALLLSHVVELKFRRRTPKKGFKESRRMLCTNDPTLLNSVGGIKVLNFRLPSGNGLSYNPTIKNLVCVWDIFMQDWRMVNCFDCDVVSVIRTSPDPKKFWDYFIQKISKMSASQKTSFMNN